MSSLTNINNNASVVNVGRTTPVSPGQQTASKSIPVVLASDQSPIPVIEQNKIQSEVALSLLGIPRAEVALGIFADVNTYDVNPAEWSLFPETYTESTGAYGLTGHGIKHKPDEAGALVEAPKDEIAVLTSKRFFRYQPGRVSAATFGVKSTRSPIADYGTGEYDLNPAIRKFGIFDKLDGYYWETIADGNDDRFSVVRRTQSLLKYIPVIFGSGQNEDHGIAGKVSNDTGAEPNAFPTATKLLRNERFILASTAFAAVVTAGGANATYLTGLSAASQAKCLRDMDLAIDAYLFDLQYGGDAHTIVNATTYATAILNNPTAESAVHDALGTAIFNFLNSNNESAAATKVQSTLVPYIADAVGGVQPSGGQIAAANYGTRLKIITIFSIYRRYLGYLAATYLYGATITYSPPVGFTEDEIRYKCLRDVKYVVDGYARDLAYGGNAGTVFNAKSYYFDGLQVYSQLTGGNPAEIARHGFLKDLISSTSTVAVGSSTPISSVFTKFGLTASKTTFDALATIIINNFTTEYSGQMENGTGPQFGNLVILRDNLLMTHAAVHDPLLLKPKKQIVVKINTGNTLETADDEFIKGQYINFYGTDSKTAGGTGLTVGKLYKVGSVSGPKSNVITLLNPTSNDAAVTITVPSNPNIKIYIEPNVPFIFPNQYYVGQNPSAGDNVIRPDGAFPYMYVDADSTLPVAGDTPFVGFIDTAIDTSINAATLKGQIDNVNLIYNNWVKQNVDPKYYSVYEYRVPRSRFSTDQLNGETNKVVYSDIATGSDGKVYAGEPVKVGGIQTTNTSVWDLDFTKVTMLKIEFSWYGAVGALFLAYVPVSNGEARWVRVHHLRASNQLKISSLGNATLPITYLVYGGGSVNRLGIEDSTSKGYGTVSDHIVKYGASYYIDGGDRGTVRLYSYSTDNSVNVYGSKYSIGSITPQSDAIGTYIDVTGVSGLPSNKAFFMNAKLLTGSNADQNVEIIWVNGTRLYLNIASLNSTSSLFLVANRPSIIFGLKAKEAILNQLGVGVRNRVQVYPTKLSTANLGTVPVKLKVLKTPYFQPDVTTSGSFTITSNYTITPDNLALTTSSTGYLPNDGDFIYGWFRANVGTVFGKLYKENGSYYFSLLQTFSIPVILLSGIAFLKDGRFDFQGNTLTTVSESAVTKERLSSVFVSTQIQTPIPKTGIEVTSFFLKPGSDQFDLLSYFDYNKDYLSYPLTDQIESLYLTSSGAQASTGSPITSIDASMTWEEQ